MKIFTKSLKLTKKGSVIIIIITAAIMTAAVLIRSSPGCAFGLKETIDLHDTKGREQYLNGWGWEIDTLSETETTVLLPRELEGAIAEYAAMQTEQGYDFEAYAGLECTQYTYVVTNYPANDRVYATMFIKNGHIIGGDIHSASIDGFMHGIKQESSR